VIKDLGASKKRKRLPRWSEEKERGGKGFWEYRVKEKRKISKLSFRGSQPKIKVKREHALLFIRVNCLTWEIIAQHTSEK